MKTLSSCFHEEMKDKWIKGVREMTLCFKRIFVKGQNNNNKYIEHIYIIMCVYSLLAQ